MTTSYSDRLALATQIAQRLGETESAPIGQIRRIVERIPLDQVIAWVEIAQGIEASGGELLPDGSRRRTLGGIFFRVARDGMTPEQQAEIFTFQWRKGKKLKKPAAQPTEAKTPATTAPGHPTATWEDRDTAITEANQQPGKATTVKMTVIGKVGKAVERQGFTLLTLQSDGTLPALPKGIPIPAQPLPTSYILYVGSRQWAKVKESLKNPEDVLIAEGIPLLDPKYAAITVFVTNTATKLMQAAQREQKTTNGAE